MPFLPPNQQHQSTEVIVNNQNKIAIESGCAEVMVSDVRHLLPEQLPPPPKSPLQTWQQLPTIECFWGRGWEVITFKT